jgi:hypothetical protein
MLYDIGFVPNDIVRGSKLPPLPVEKETVTVSGGTQLTTNDINCCSGLVENG